MSASPQDGAQAPAGGGRSRILAAWVDTPMEIAIAVIVSVAGLMTSWSSYQAALWDGEQAAHYSEANAAHVAGSRAAMRGGQLQGIDVLMFSQWLDAYAAGESRLEDFYRVRFRAEFRPAFEAWLKTGPRNNPHAPPTPFVLPAYRIGEAAEAERLERQAGKLFDQGQRANSISDAFVQGTVILASAMFFGGVCQAFRTPGVRLMLILVALVACVLGLIRILSLPAAQLG